MFKFSSDFSKVRWHGSCATRSVLYALAIFFGLCACIAAQADDGFLDPKAAFQFSASEKPGAIDVHFVIADGYYLYREPFAFAVKSGQATLGEIRFPPAQVKFDQTFNKAVQTYRGNLVLHVPIIRASGPFDLVVTSQGCADKGVCYPPVEHVTHVSEGGLMLAGARDQPQAQPQAQAQAQAHAFKQVAAGATVYGSSLQGSERFAANASASFFERFLNTDDARSVLQQQGLFVILGFFFASGIALSLFPCSLPMIPILSSIIVGEGIHVTRARGFALSVAYVLGMALVFAMLGVMAAVLGQGLGGWLQNPWVLGVFAALIAALACMLLAGRDLQMPQGLQQRVNAISQRQAGGKLVAVFVMGALSAMVTGACMSAPLAAILLFIAHTGSVMLGAAALFAMGIGNGVPLLIVGLGAGTLLPRAGVWMEGVKRFFGMMLLAVAFWLVTPVLPAAVAMLLGALWLFCAAAALHLFEHCASVASIWWRLGKGLGAALAVWAAALIVGVAAGSSDPLKPLAVLTGVRADSNPAATVKPVFAPVRSIAELERAFGSGQRRVTMLDFYANWCTSCKEMEQFTFADSRVQARMAELNLLRADVSANSRDDRALLKRFRLFGPPGIIFLDARGDELGRVVGYQSPELFLERLTRMLGEPPVRPVVPASAD